MKLSAPKKNTFWVSTVLSVLGVVAFFVPAFSSFAFWLVLAGNVVLWLGTYMKGF